MQSVIDIYGNVDQFLPASAPDLSGFGGTGSVIDVTNNAQGGVIFTKYLGDNGDTYTLDTTYSTYDTQSSKVKIELDPAENNTIYLVYKKVPS